MKNKYILIISLVVIAVVGYSAFFGKTAMFKGSFGPLSFQKDAPIVSSQIVAGTTDVRFRKFSLSANSAKDLLIKKIVIRQEGTNKDGIVNIGIYDDAILVGGIRQASFGADVKNPTIAVFDYSATPYRIQRGQTKIFTIKADTVYSATSGSTVKMVLDSVNDTPVSTSSELFQNIQMPPIPPTFVLYPTKLNFEWVETPATSLLAGSQIEVGRFKMGADAANANNPGAFVSVAGLNLTDFSTAALSNFTLNDITYNLNAAVVANSSSFNSTAAGGTMSTVIFQQGEQRTFKILADVRTNAGTQFAQFRFNAGTQFNTGSATWSVTNNAVTSSSTWTVLAGNAASALSY